MTQLFCSPSVFYKQSVFCKARIYPKTALAVSLSVIAWGVPMWAYGETLDNKALDSSTLGSSTIDGERLHNNTQAAPDQTTDNQNTPISSNTTNPAHTIANNNTADIDTPAKTESGDETESDIALQRLAHFYQPPIANQCQGNWQFVHSDTPPTQAGDLYARADYAYYDRTQSAQLSGNVLLEQNGRQIHSTRLDFNAQTGQAYATGDVVFGERINPNDVLIGVAKDLHYNTQTGQASANQIAFANQGLHAHGYAKSLTRPTPNHYQLEQTLFSSCPPNNRTWHLDAQSLTLDTKLGRGIAKNATLNIKNIPVLYVPYFNFPLNNKRSSGFLVPRLSLNNNGTQISTPYYFNLAPNYDATLTPTLSNNNNPRLAGEFRYLSPSWSGTLSGAYLPKDKRYGLANRHHLSLDYAWQSPTAPLSLSAIYRHVSDNRYGADFHYLGMDTPALNLPRRLQANYHHPNVDVVMVAEDYQRLQATDGAGLPILDTDRPYARLPQLAINYRLPITNTDWQVSGVSNSTYFRRAVYDINAHTNTPTEGIRLYNQLSGAYHWQRPWAYLIPKVSLTHLSMQYDNKRYDNNTRTAQQNNQQTISHALFVPTISLEGGLHLQKSGSPFNTHLGGYQLLSPRLKYSYSAYQAQSMLPNFETSIAPISYEQLFSDNPFLGYDRLSDLHAVSAGINYRYIDRDGNTRLDGSIAQQLPLAPTNARPQFPIIAWQATWQPTDTLWLDSSGSLGRDYQPKSLIAAVRYQPYANMLFHLGLTERKADHALGQLPISAYHAAAIVPINPRWQVVASTQYNHQYRHFMDTLLGVAYHDCCIGVAVYARQYRHNLTPTAGVNRAIMAEIRLNGLSGEGSLSRLLSERLLGYRPAW